MVVKRFSEGVGLRRRRIQIDQEWNENFQDPWFPENVSNLKGRSANLGLFKKCTEIHAFVKLCRAMGEENEFQSCCCFPGRTKTEEGRRKEWCLNLTKNGRTRLLLDFREFCLADFFYQSALQ